MHVGIRNTNWRERNLVKKKQKTQKLVQLWEKKNGKRLQQLPRENPHETGIALPNETK